MKTILICVAVILVTLWAKNAVQVDQLKEESRVATNTENAARDHGDKIRRAKINHELCDGMNYLDAKQVLGDLWPVGESDGAGGRYQSYYHNDGTYTTTLYFYNGSLLRWTKISNY